MYNSNESSLLILSIHCGLVDCKFLGQRFSNEDNFALQGYLAMFEDIFDCHNSVCVCARVCNQYLMGKSWGCCQISYKTTMKNYLVQNANSAQIEKPYPRDTKMNKRRYLSSKSLLSSEGVQGGNRAQDFRVAEKMGCLSQNIGRATGICQRFSGWKEMISGTGNNMGKYLDMYKAWQNLRNSSSSEWLELGLITREVCRSQIIKISYAMVGKSLDLSL